MNKGICTKIRIGEKIQEWKKKKGYLKSGITLIDVCQELNVNRTYMSNFINEKYRKNFNTWINELRVKESVRMLQSNQRLSLTEVGERIGYSDLAHFSKQFKIVMGVSPSSWRKEKYESKFKK